MMGRGKGGVSSLLEQRERCGERVFVDMLGGNVNGYMVTMTTMKSRDNSVECITT